MARTKRTWTLVSVGESGSLHVERYDDVDDLKVRLADFSSTSDSTPPMLFVGDPVPYGNRVTIGERKPLAPKANGKAKPRTKSSKSTELIDAE